MNKERKFTISKIHKKLKKAKNKKKYELLKQLNSLKKSFLITEKIIISEILNYS